MPGVGAGLKAGVKTTLTPISDIEAAPAVLPQHHGKRAVTMLLESKGRDRQCDWEPHSPVSDVLCSGDPAMTFPVLPRPMENDSDDPATQWLG